LNIGRVLVHEKDFRDHSSGFVVEWECLFNSFIQKRFNTFESKNGKKMNLLKKIFDIVLN